MSRIKTSDEYYTPSSIINLSSCDNWISKRIDGPFIDVNCGNGNWLVYILEKKLSKGITLEESLKKIYGVEIQEDSVAECRNRLIKSNEKLRPIVERNIVCADALRYHYRFDGSDPYKTKQDLHIESLFS
jgi:hypothetical protein